MIYTCTMTPSIDYTTYLPSFQSGELNRTNEVYYYPGGKGINVSRVLQRLGIDTTATGFAGGFTGDYVMDFLKQEGVQTDFIETENITRINVKIKADTESELNGPGPNITEDQFAQLTAKIQTLSTNDWFVLAGSLPNSIKMDDYRRILATCRENNVPFVLDTSGPALKALIQEKPFLIKPNEHELGELFNVTIRSKQDAIIYAKKLVETGIQHVIVSLGSEGAILVSEKQVLAATAPKGQAINTVGAGDSLVSGFLASYVMNHDTSAAFQYGVATGSATAFTTDLCEKKDVIRLVDEVKIETLEWM
ncbi:1-phosphofructokinase [Oceanobacillus jordanicus]|uniref:Tagatose-6-phosphate kinase n=1 Tax=Oceanobacillus jordanicus TaxID=2867266 RepID=A0AAW5B4R1_9BACI|nr:1-phosphofructokinase [Oceanobacillus jordanicus]MCG3419272.1 1-phosphofructokinase [Oceanobacillus jordanicus]